MVRNLFAALLVLTSTTAHAQYESREYFRYKAWQVELTHNTQTGGLWCDANTMNRRGQSFSITAFDSNIMTMFVFDNTWSLRERPLRFLVDIDYSRWIIDGTAGEKSVSLTFNDIEKTLKFLGELQSSNAVAVLNQDERRIATFSLAGSRRALEALMECWGSISTSDPFESSKDPF